MRIVLARLSPIFISLSVISLIFISQSFARIDPKSIVGIWLFDEGKGDVAKDSSKNGYDGEIKGSLKWVDGKLGGGLEFPGQADNCVNIPHDDALNLTTFTITYWGKLHETATWQIPVGKAGNGSSIRNFDFQIPGGGGTVSVYFTQGASQWKGASAKTVVSDDKWHHVAGTYDLQNLRIYVDGVMEGENTYKGPPDHIPEPLTIGDMVSAHPVGGILDEIGIFNQALTEGDIGDIMTKGLERAVGITAIFPSAKLTTTWSSIKTH